MRHPPHGTPMTPENSIVDDFEDLDKYDAEVLKSLAENDRCQLRLITDRGQHYIFCGGYYHGAAKPTPRGLRCHYHRNK